MKFGLKYFCGNLRLSVIIHVYFIHFPFLPQSDAEQVKKAPAKQLTSKNHHQRLENIVKQTVVESRVGNKPLGGSVSL